MTDLQEEVNTLKARVLDLTDERNMLVQVVVEVGEKLGMTPENTVADLIAAATALTDG